MAKRRTVRGRRLGRASRDAGPLAALKAADGKYVFGPMFFLTRLRPLVLDRCRAPEDRLPTVHLHLSDGEVLDVCHFAGLAPRWAVVSAYARDRREDPGAMKTVLVPYEAIARITIREEATESVQIGFHPEHLPQALAARAPSAPRAGAAPGEAGGPRDGDAAGAPGVAPP